MAMSDRNVPSGIRWERINYMRVINKVFAWLGIVVIVVVGSAILWPYLNYGNSEYWRKKGSRLLHEESYEDALEVYVHLTALNSRDIDAWDSKADVLYQLKRYGEAIETYDQVLSLDPDRHNAAFFKAQALGLTGQSEEALDVYDRLLDFGADYPVKMKGGESPQPSFDVLLLEGKAHELVKLRRFEEAVGVYDDAIQKAPQNLILRNAKSVPLIWLKRYKDVVKNSEDILTMNPDSLTESVAWNIKGGAFALLKLYDDALQAYDRALRLRPDRDLIWYNSARVHALMGNQDSAVSCLRTAIELNPSLKDSIKEDAALQAMNDLDVFK